MCIRDRSCSFLVGGGTSEHATPWLVRMVCTLCLRRGCAVVERMNGKALAGTGRDTTASVSRRDKEHREGPTYSYSSVLDKMILMK